MLRIRAAAFFVGTLPSFGYQVPELIYSMAISRPLWPRVRGRGEGGQGVCGNPRWIYKVTRGMAALSWGALGWHTTHTNKRARGSLLERGDLDKGSHIARPFVSLAIAGPSPISLCVNPPPLPLPRSLFYCACVPLS